MNLSKINRIWPKIGGLLSIIILAIMIWSIEVRKPYLLSWLYWLHLPLLLIHEFEEYVYPGEFKHFFSTDTVLSPSNPKENPILSEKMIFFINIGIWVLIIISASLAKIVPWFGLIFVIFELVNVVGHGGIFQINSKGYNPGLLSAVFLLLPYTISVLWIGIGQNFLGTLDVILGIVFGLILGASMPLSVKLKKKKQKDTSSKNLSLD